MTDCECKGPGFCKRHGISKNEAWYRLCKTRPKYFNAWEKGAGPGQNIPKDERQGPPTPGPGTELTKIFSWFGLNGSASCHCTSHAAEMDRWGPDRCEKNLAIIVQWLADEAKNQRLPFVKFGASLLVKTAIKRSRKRIKEYDEEYHGH